MTRVVDFSFSRPSVTSLKAAGVTGVIRYVCEDPGKMITPQEARGYRTADISIALVYEDGAEDFTGGANEGVAKARVAAPLLDAIGFGKARPVYAAVDGNLDPSLYQITYEGIHAFASALSRPDACYGPRPFLHWLQQTHGVEWLWELGSSSFNYGPEPKYKRLQQLVTPPVGCPVTIGGCSVDWDQPLCADFGQWPAPAPPKPKPAPRPTPTEDDVTIHPITVHIASNGQGDTATDIPTAKVVGVVPIFGLGPNPGGAVGIVDNGGKATVCAKGWEPGLALNVHVSEAA